MRYSNIQYIISKILCLYILHNLCECAYICIYTYVFFFQLRRNVDKIFEKFIHEGKVTIRMLKPDDDIALSKVTCICFIHKPWIGNHGIIIKLYVIFICVSKTVYKLIHLWIIIIFYIIITFRLFLFLKQVASRCNYSYLLENVFTGGRCHVTLSGWMQLYI